MLSLTDDRKHTVYASVLAFTTLDNHTIVCLKVIEIPLLKVDYLAQASKDGTDIREGFTDLDHL